MHVTGQSLCATAEHMRTKRPAMRIHADVDCSDFKAYVQMEESKARHGRWLMQEPRAEPTLAIAKETPQQPAKSPTRAHGISGTLGVAGKGSTVPHASLDPADKDAIWDVLPHWRRDEYKQLRRVEESDWWQLILKQDVLPIPLQQDQSRSEPSEHRRCLNQAERCDPTRIHGSSKGMESYNVIVINNRDGPLGFEICFVSNSWPTVGRVHCLLLQRLGLRPGQRILRLNGTDIRNNTQGWLLHVSCFRPLEIAFGTWADDHIETEEQAMGVPGEQHTGKVSDKEDTCNHAPRHLTARLGGKTFRSSYSAQWDLNKT
jgi:hypothetical protein